MTAVAGRPGVASGIDGAALPVDDTVRPRGRGGPGFRGAVPGLPVSASLTQGLPAAFLAAPGGGFPQDFLAAFDSVLAPVIATLDDFDAYLDPRTAPEDFTRWLAGWVSLDVDQRWDVAAVRRRVAGAAAVYRLIGTVEGIARGVELLCGVRPEVRDSGGVTWSPRPGGGLPGESRAEVVVSVPAGTDRDAVERVVVALKPAHLPHRIEVG